MREGGVLAGDASEGLVEEVAKAVVITSLQPGGKGTYTMKV